MNKTQLVDALAARMGDRNTAATAVDGLLETIVDTVGAGESVSITGFGVFESRARAARVARNPRTGEAVDVPATTVPAFRAGAGFRTKVGGGGVPAPRSAPTRRRSAATDTAVEEAAAPVAPATGGKAGKADTTAKRKPAKKKAAADAEAVTATAGKDTAEKDTDGGGKGKKGKKK